MLKQCLCLILFFCLFAIAFPKNVYAIVDPLTSPNNKVGIHILFPSELQDAARLVNTSGGDWGYVTIPIQTGDRDLIKWQGFMNQARAYHLIPIIRLATEGDYFNTKVWRKPTTADLVDFSNFLNSLEWPTKNRYVVIFNETNRADEWGGAVDPNDYATILLESVAAFKSRSEDFFIISAGLDNAAATTTTSMNEFQYLRAMEIAVPGIFNQIDGLGSHSYPNPAFAKPADRLDRESIATFRYEKTLVGQFSIKDLPLFIIETGWSNEAVAARTIATYFQEAYATAWNDRDVIAVTPFLLRAGGPPFEKFSLLRTSGGPTNAYTAIHDIPKVKGNPIVNESVKGIEIVAKDLPLKKFATATEKQELIPKEQTVKTVIKWLLGMPI